MWLGKTQGCYYHREMIPWLLGQEEKVDSHKYGLKERVKLGMLLRAILSWMGRG